MPDIHKLNERRVQAEMMMKALGMMNTPTDAEEQLKARAQYRLYYDAWWAAEKEYQDAINSMSAEELKAITNGQSAKE